ncbi:hypothetical protein IGI04_041102 [Brassica rapa subsp. trilocularis]|uniref:NPH3 domain-containing protein n=1 Tax=Brassica rapa subsp. trilocularis TaxID=1813537 RepID=A0ABQ7KTW6_BRACM|nr:hypothetical protein IGI04_041102 [Brassica rapa subsp. trilocularis]
MGITVLFLDEKVIILFANYVIHGFIPAGRAKHYMSSLKAGSIVKVDRFEVARCLSMYKITDHPFLICFISPTIIDEVITDVVEKIRSLQGSDLTKEITRVVIRLLIDSKLQTLINTNNNDFCLHITLQIKEKQIQPYQEIQETLIPTDTNVATTSPPAHSSCLMKIAYMPNVNMPMLFSSYEKYINSFKTY